MSLVKRLAPYVRTAKPPISTSRAPASFRARQMRTRSSGSGARAYAAASWSSTHRPRRNSKNDRPHKGPGARCRERVRPFLPARPGRPWTTCRSGGCRRLSWPHIMAPGGTTSPCRRRRAPQRISDGAHGPLSGSATKPIRYTAAVDMTGLPGAALVEQGLRDIAAGHETEAALLVLIGEPRLRRLGLVVSEPPPAWSATFVTRAPALRPVGALGCRFRPLALQRAHPHARQLRTGRRMRALTDAARLRQFMRVLGQRTRARGRVYLVGGACAAIPPSTRRRSGAPSSRRSRR